MNKHIKFDEEQIRREIRNKVPGIYELRIIMSDFYNTKLSCYFHTDDPDSMIRQMMSWRYPPNCCINHYLTINPVKEYCEAREQFNSLRKTKIMTDEADIDRLTWFAVDVDPEHPRGTSASDEEKEEARKQAAEVTHYMEDLGFSYPEIVDSGNGYHLKYRIDLDNTPENRELLRNMNRSLSAKFPLIDASIKDVSRVLKLPGTMAMKGRSTPERPYRMARILKDPLGLDEGRGSGDVE